VLVKVKAAAKDKVPAVVAKVKAVVIKAAVAAAKAAAAKAVNLFLEEGSPPPSSSKQTLSASISNLNNSF
jgi:membrane protein involved in colicin uptake